MTRWANRAIPGLLAAIAILLFWTSQAAWGRLAADGTRYKFDLTGVARITNFGSPAEVRDHCNWYESPANRRQCSASPTGANAFRLVRLAPGAATISLLSFLALAWITARDARRGPDRALPVISFGGSLAMLAAIQLLTRNVGKAIAIYAGHTLEMRGSGLAAAWLLVLLFAVTAALTVPSHFSSRNR